MSARRWVVAVAAVVVALRVVCVRASAPPPPPIRIATFNIEDFPKNERQIAGAFAEIAALGAGIVGVQEITDPEVFVRELHARLGAQWGFEHDEEEPWGDHPLHHVGVLWDRDAYTFESRRVHEETRLGARHKAVLEVRLRPRAGGDVIRVHVIHFRCCSEGRETRALQHAALREIIARAVPSGERIVVLGDFNATHDIEDRGDLAALAAHTGIAWATEGLACSAFWAREDGCPTSRLDHVLTWSAPARVEAAGACATEGCGWQARCPAYKQQVSDHCPVVVTFE